MFISNIFKLTSVNLSVILRILIVFTGAVTTFLVATKLNPEEQGYFYTILSLLNASIFIELGLNSILIHLYSRQRSNLKISKNDIFGDYSYLNELCRFIFIWFLCGTIILLILLIVSFFIFFNDGSDILSFPSWFLIIFFSCLSFLLNPFLVFIEGIGLLKPCYKIKIIHVSISNLVYWFFLILGYGLDAVWIYYMIFSISLLFLLYLNHWKLLKKVYFQKKNRSLFNWKKDLFSIQYRTAILSLGAYFFYSLPIPIIFVFMDSTVAGRFGLSLSVMAAFLALANGLSAPYISKFGILIFRKKIRMTLYLIKNLTKKLLSLSFLFIITYTAFLFIIKLFYIDFYNRFLPIEYNIIYSISYILLTLTIPFYSFVRASKKEPLYFIALIIGLIYLLFVYLGSIYNTISSIPISFLIFSFIFLFFSIYFFQNEKMKHVNI